MYQVNLPPSTRGHSTRSWRSFLPRCRVQQRLPGANMATATWRYHVSGHSAVQTRRSHRHLQQKRHLWEQCKLRLPIHLDHSLSQSLPASVNINRKSLRTKLRSSSELELSTKIWLRCWKKRVQYLRRTSPNWYHKSPPFDPSFNLPSHQSCLFSPSGFQAQQRSIPVGLDEPVLGRHRFWRKLERK